MRLRRDGFQLDVACELTARTTGLFGPSGAGKTTILHLLAGLTRPAEGRIVLDGDVLFDHARRIHVPPHRRGIGVVFQDDRLFPHLTIRDNLRFGERMVPRRRRRFSLDAVAEILELGPLLDRGTGRLSGGERRRVALARALMASPRLLLLDEPLTGLDHGRKEQILPFLHRVQAELQTPMLLVSHDLADILHLTDQMLVVDRGSVAAEGKLVDLVHQPRALELIRTAGLLNVLRLEVKEHRPREAATLLAARRSIACPSTSLAAPAPCETRRGRPLVLRAPWLTDVAPGTAVDAILRPEDVALATSPVEGISMQNQFRGRLRNILSARGKTLCIVEAGDTTLLVDVTHEAVAQLGLTPGRPVWCLCKVNAVRCVAMQSPTVQNPHATEQGPPADVGQANGRLDLPSDVGWAERSESHRRKCRRMNAE
jgi:molybdate transport system ATP-binding protein